MKKLQLILLVFFMPVLAFGQQWLRTQGGLTNDGAGSIAATNTFHTITSLWFSGMTTANSVNYLSTGGTDMLIIKTSNNGQFVWIKQMGGNGDDQPLATVTDNSGNIYVGGFFNGTFTAGSTTLVSAGGQDAFLLKLDPSGNVAWAKRAGGIYNDQITSLAITAGGTIYCTGNFTGTASFDAVSLTSQNLGYTTAFSQDVFIGAYTNTGVLLWMNKGGGRYSDKAVGVAADANGDAYFTGQFSDTIQFVIQHPNTLLNAVYLVKYDAAGNEVWFSKAGGGGLSNVRGIVFSQGSIYIAGECSGNTQFFGPPVIIATNPYSERIFLAGYTTAGNLKWVHTDGSSSPLTAGGVAADPAGNLYIAGTFRCKFNEYCNQYGQGVFNSIGFTDVFVSRYDSTGTRTWSRHAGGPDNDEVNGIVVDSVDNPAVCGSFGKRFLYPSSPSFATLFPSPTQASMPSGGANCGDIYYSSISYYSALGGRDVFYGKLIDLDRLPYDYYKRTVNTCIPDPVDMCVSLAISDNICQEQSIPGCGGFSLYANSNTSNATVANSSSSPGPEWTYLWNTGATSRNFLANVSGTYTATITSADGCFSSSDSITVVVNQVPSAPTVSDTKFINFNTSFPLPIEMCIPDSAILFVTNALPGYTVSWLYNSTTILNDSVTVFATVPQNTFAVATLTAPNGCSASTGVPIQVSAALAPAFPEMVVSDTISFCGAPVQVQLVDSLTGIPCSIPDLLSVQWLITPAASYSGGPCTLNQLITFSPPSNGTYTLQATIVRGSCGVTDTIVLTRTVVVQTGTPPIVNGSVTGQPVTEWCAGVPIQFTASGGTSYLWSNGSTGSTITVLAPGNYCVTIFADSGTGCVGTQNVCRQVVAPMPPVITSAQVPAILCPLDSVLLVSITQGTNYNWSGPGVINANNDSVYVNAPGSYYCNVTNTNGCTLISNLVNVVQYATPFLSVSPGVLFCQGDTVTLSVQAASNAQVVWDTPLSGTGFTQEISQDGTYSCSITSCGIVTVDSVILTSIQVIASLPMPDTSICYGDTLMLTPAPFSGQALWFPDSVYANQLPVSSSGSYYLQVTDPNGCTGTSNMVIVNVDSVAGALQILATTPLCEGEQLYISPVLGGGGTISWSGPGGFSSSFQDILIDSVLPSQGGYYVLSISDGICESIPDSVEIVVYDSVPHYQLLTSALCEGQPAQIQTVPFLDYQYNWTLPSGLVLQDSILQINNYNASLSGYYLLHVENGTCPAFTDSVYLGLPAAGFASIQVIDSVVCEGDTMMLDAICSPGIINWLPGNTTGSNFPALNSGPVYFSVTDTSGCIFLSDTFQVSFYSAPVIAPINPQTVCEGDPVQVMASVIPGTVQQVNYSWSGPGFTSNSLALQIPSALLNNSGIYTFMAEDSVCKGSAEIFTLQVINPPTSPEITVSEPECIGDSILILLNGNSQAVYSFLTPSGNTVQTDSLVILSAQPSDSGLYIIITEVVACPALSDSVYIDIDSCKITSGEVYIPNIFTPNNDGVNEIFVPRLPFGEDGILKVYNRWGDLLYEGRITDGWNGRDSDGVQQLSGVYYWIMLTPGFRPSSRNGFVELIR